MPGAPGVQERNCMSKELMQKNIAKAQREIDEKKDIVKNGKPELFTAV